ncbi:MAG: hypothetical protein ACTTJ3_03005 [Treponema sp.]
MVLYKNAKKRIKLIFFEVSKIVVIILTIELDTLFSRKSDKFEAMVDGVTDIMSIVPPPVFLYLQYIYK